MEQNSRHEYKSELSNRVEVNTLFMIDSDVHSYYI